VAFDDLTARARALLAELEERAGRAEAALAREATAASPEARVAAVQDAARALFGEDMVLLPAVALAPVPARELALAWGDADRLVRHTRDELGSDDPVEDWLHGIARVRETLGDLEATIVLGDALGRRAGGDGTTPRALRLRPAQLPRDPDAHWLALQFPPAARPAEDRLLYTAAYARDVTEGGEHAGLLLDEWIETVPVPDVSAGLAFHFDRPSTEPPQAWLLVAPAEVNGSWSWDELVAALHETLDLARLRAVEPDLLDETSWAPFLPATVFPVMTYQVSLMVNLAANNGVFERLREG
jgi:hypothetical protein